MANFTPEEISEILAQFFDVVGKRQYIGARYVPIFGRKDETSILWDNTKPYEPLTIVLYQGNSYTSRQYVPIGVEIDDESYWALTGNYNAQVEQYRRDVEFLGNAIPISDFDAEHTVKDYVDGKASDIDAIIPSSDFDAEHTVKDYIDGKASDIDAIIPSYDFDDEHTVKDYIDSEIGSLNSDIVKTINLPFASVADANAFFNDYNMSLSQALKPNTVIPTETGITYGRGPNFGFGPAPSIQNRPFFIALVDSWIRHADEFVYGHGEFGGHSYIGSYNNPVLLDPREHKDPNNKFYIDCADFTYMIGNGIRYNNSAYARGVNIPFNPMYNETDESVKPYWFYGVDASDELILDNEHPRRLMTYQSAKYLYDFGRLTYVNTARDVDRTMQVPTGAIIYSGGQDNRFLGIGHCSMFLGTYGNDLYIAESTDNYATGIVVRKYTFGDYSIRGYYLPNYSNPRFVDAYMPSAYKNQYGLDFVNRDLSSDPFTDFGIQASAEGCVYCCVSTYSNSNSLTNVHITLTPSSYYKAAGLTNIQFDLKNIGIESFLFPASMNISIGLNDTSITTQTYNIRFRRVMEEYECIPIGRTM